MMIEKNEKADFHIHTTQSDGENGLVDIIKKAQKAKLSVIAITDHNTITVKKPIVLKKLQVIPGVEMSALFKYNQKTIEVHILGIFPYGVKNLLEENMRKIEYQKDNYIKAVLDDLNKRLNTNISMEELQAISESKHIGRMHIAKALVERGIEPTIESALDHQIGNQSKYYIPSWQYIEYPSVEEVSRSIAENRGVAILAHPQFYNLTKDELEQLVDEIKEGAGDLAGLEVYYEKYIGENSVLQSLEKLAKKKKLIMTGGSDRHRNEEGFATATSAKLLDVMIEKLNIKRG